MSLARHDTLLQELTGTSEGFLRSLEGIPGDRWSYAPAPEVWSVEQTAEHTVAVFRSIQRLVAKKLLERPLPPGEKSPISDDMIVRAMFHRGRRYEAPEFALPKGRWATPGELIAAFLEARELLLKWLDETTVDLRSYTADHAMIGQMDGVQWLLFAAAHTERHTHQILEFRQHEGF